MLSGVIRDASRTLSPGGDQRHGPLPPLLLLLTLVAGVVDAVSFLGLGQVFVANMTGNIVLLGFALGGARDLSVSAALVALAAFTLGAFAAGRLGARLPAHRGHLLTAAIVLKLVPVLVALVIAAKAGAPPGTAARYAMIVLLAVAMGLQSGTARRLAVPDLNTTVVTMTLAALVADSAQTPVRAGRRLAAVLAMLIGAIAGAFLVLRVSTAAALAVAGAALVLAGVLARVASVVPAPWTAPA